uniref:G-protein coupled receptors family 2 profile 2 domain-containing protein n=1 Tax=Strigamia maritima TaxID=126957 RepID=T1JN35_STRMM
NAKFLFISLEKIFYAFSSVLQVVLFHKLHLSLSSISNPYRKNIYGYGIFLSIIYEKVEKFKAITMNDTRVPFPYYTLRNKLRGKVSHLSLDVSVTLKHFMNEDVSAFNIKEFYTQVLLKEETDKGKRERGLQAVTYIDTHLRKYSSKWAFDTIKCSKTSSKLGGLRLKFIKTKTISINVGGEEFLSYSVVITSCVLHLRIGFVFLGLYCNTSYDRISCWPTTKAGSLAIIPCFAELRGIKYDVNDNASRLCQQDGIWERNSNYSNCKIIHEHHHWHLLMNNDDVNRWTMVIYYTGYSLSLAALIVALSIFITFNEIVGLCCKMGPQHEISRFSTKTNEQLCLGFILDCYYKKKKILKFGSPCVHTKIEKDIFRIFSQFVIREFVVMRLNCIRYLKENFMLEELDLRCLRNTFHTNLLLTYVLVNLTWICTALAPVIHSNSQSGACVLVILLLYFQGTNFFWMFVEGFYLYLLVVRTFQAGKVKLYIYMLIGWEFPKFSILLMHAKHYKHNFLLLDMLHCYKSATGSIFLSTLLAESHGVLFANGCNRNLGNYKSRTDGTNGRPFINIRTNGNRMPVDTESFVRLHLLLSNSSSLKCKYKLLRINILFLIQIMWVLITKLRVSTSAESQQYRKCRSSQTFYDIHFAVVSKLSQIAFLVFQHCSIHTHAHTGKKGKKSVRCQYNALRCSTDGRRQTIKSFNALEMKLIKWKKKAAKALLVLIPLLGVTYILFITAPDPNKDLSAAIFAYIRAFLLSTQYK